MNIKRTCQFLLDKEKDKPDAKLRYRIKWNNSKAIVAFNVGYRVDVDKWSGDTQRCKNNSTHGSKKISASIINREIQRYESFAEETFADFEKQNTTPSTEEFRSAFNAHLGKSAAKVGKSSFFEVFDEFTSEMGRLNQWTESTYEKFRTVKRHLKDFSTGLTFGDITNDRLVDYIYFLRDERDMRNTTIAKQIEFLKWFLRWATAKGYNTNNAYLTFSPKLKVADKKVIFLDWDELMTVYKYNIPDSMQGLQGVRDVFCFCCFTSLRYSDVANLKRSDVFGDHILVTTVKTSDSLKIELNNYSLAILEKYKGQVFANDLALPVISNQKMNDALKSLGKLCGIDKDVTITYYKGNTRIDEVLPKYELLTTHAGRRTFICNALIMGIAPHVVMKWTGHSDYKAMTPYIDVADRAKAEAMTLFNK